MTNTARDFLKRIVILKSMFPLLEVYTSFHCGINQWCDVYVQTDRAMTLGNMRTISAIIGKEPIIIAIDNFIKIKID
jgi:hypothetical protein